MFSRCKQLFQGCFDKRIPEYRFAFSRKNRSCHYSRIQTARATQQQNMNALSSQHVKKLQLVGRRRLCHWADKPLILQPISWSHDNNALTSMLTRNTNTMLWQLVMCMSIFSLASSSCNSDWDCSLNGVCQGGVCKCDPAWDDGLNCSKLQSLAVTVPTAPSCNQPGCAYHGDPSANTSTTWGGSVLKGHDGKYHMYVSEMANHCGLGDWRTNSFIAHAVADTPLGPFTRSDTAVPVWSVCPEVDILKTDNETLYLMYIMGDGTPIGNISSCTSKEHSQLRETSYDEKESLSDTVDGNQTITIHSSTSPYGPWTRTEALMLNIPPLGNWCPTVNILANGTVRLMFLNAGDIIQIMQADHWRGPYYLMTPVGKAVTSCSVYRFKWCVEGEFLYQDARGNWHALFHMFDYPNHTKPLWCGGHSFSRDGLVWSNASQAYNNSIHVSYPNQSSGFIWALRRERPKLLFDQNGIPTHIYNGVDMPGLGTYTMVTPLGHN